MDHKRIWQIERRIPIAVILALLIQVISALIWATQLDARVSNVEQQAISSNSLNEKFARLEERLDNVKQDIAAVKRQLDHLTDHLLKP